MCFYLKIICFLLISFFIVSITLTRNTRKRTKYQRTQKSNKRNWKCLNNRNYSMDACDEFTLYVDHIAKLLFGDFCFFSSSFQIENFLCFSSFSRFVPLCTYCCTTNTQQWCVSIFFSCISSLGYFHFCRLSLSNIRHCMVRVAMTRRCFRRCQKTVGVDIWWWDGASIVVSIPVRL